MHCPSMSVQQSCIVIDITMYLLGCCCCCPDASPMLTFPSAPATTQVLVLYLRHIPGEPLLQLKRICHGALPFCTQGLSLDDVTDLLFPSCNTAHSWKAIEYLTILFAFLQMKIPTCKIKSCTVIFGSIQLIGCTRTIFLAQRNLSQIPRNATPLGCPSFTTL